MSSVVMFVLLHLFAFSLFSQTTFANKHLGELIEDLSAQNIAIEQAGEFNIPSLSSDKPMVVQQNTQGVIDHIGLKLFDRDMMAKHPSPLYYFVERYLLELLVLKSDAAIQDRLRQERVKLSSELYPEVPLLTGIRKAIAGFSPTHSVFVTASNHRYTMVISNGKQEVLSLEFPIRYELITGENKLEAEASVYPKLLQHTPSEVSMPSIIDLSIYQDSLFMMNDEYYMAEYIVANSYYKKHNEQILPIFSNDKISESVYNIFNAKADWGIDVEITQKMYGNNSNTFSLPLYSLIDFLKSQHCNIYTGIKKLNRNSVEGIFLAVNTELGYQHIMMFTLDRQLFDAPDNHAIKISMFSYVPIHNITTIFGK